MGNECYAWEITTFILEENNDRGSYHAKTPSHRACQRLISVKPAASTHAHDGR